MANIGAMGEGKARTIIYYLRASGFAFHIANFAKDGELTEEAKDNEKVKVALKGDH